MKLDVKIHLTYCKKNIYSQDSTEKVIFDLHLGAVREVTSWDSMLLLDFGENHRKLVNQIMLFVFFAKNCGHLLLQIADYVDMSLGGDRAHMKPRNTMAQSVFLCCYL